ncbi:MAG: BCD family MFS transporter [Woeseiaceae bacterium]|nr:BCD family MFS transporter [Woeseiaceae bacterium]
MTTAGGLGWAGIVRLGVVQASLGAIVVLTTSTLNRVMVVELALPAMLPGALVALHYFVQISRPRFGYGSDTGRARTPWIIGGMAVLGAGGTLASCAAMLMAYEPIAGIALATFAFLLIGAGVGASGTCLLVLLAATVNERRRAAAASITWIMMIAGFAITAGTVGAFLDPFSFERLVAITAIVAAIALVATVLALRNIERNYATSLPAPAADEPQTSFADALKQVLAEPATRRFAAFVFISMLAYSAQDLVLEPFAGAVMGLTPGESTQLGGTQHGGVLVGMLVVAFLGRFEGARSNVLRNVMITGCLGSALMLLTLAAAGFARDGWPLAATVFALGLSNGVFAVAAIGCMMGLVSEGRRQRDGTRMGIWGAAQAIAFGLGGIVGTAVVDITRYVFGSVLYAYSIVFISQAVMFAIAAWLAARLTQKPINKPAHAFGVDAGTA